MRATLLPYAIILTEAHRPAVSMMTKGCMVTCQSTASEVFCILTTRLYQFFCVFISICSI